MKDEDLPSNDDSGEDLSESDEENETNEPIVNSAPATIKLLKDLPAERDKKEKKKKEKTPEELEKEKVSLAKAFLT